MDSFETIPALLRHVSHSYHHAQAFNHRVNGQWSRCSTESFVEHVRRMALGLRALGLKPGQSVGVLAESSPWWLMTDLAILIAGGVSVPLFTTSSPANLKFKLRHADIRLTFVSGAKALQRFDACKRFFSKAIVQSDDHTPAPRRSGVIDDQRLMAMGDELSIKDPALFARLCDRVQPSDIATIIYTSGTSGRPKGVILTHRNLVSQIHAVGQWYDLNCARDRGLSILPLAHAFERMVTYFCLSRGVSLWFADPADDLPGALAQVKPTAVAVVPRVLEKIYASMVSRVESAGMLGKPLGRWAIRLAHSRNGHGPTMRDRLAEGLVYAKMRQALGGHLRTVICGGAPLSPRLARFFMNIGVPVYQGYGLTEASPVITANHPGHNRIGSVGVAIPGVEVRIDEHEQVLARGPNIMVGYHRDPEATAQMIDADGWLHTGDRGRLEPNGSLTITGRIKDLCKTANGKYVSPAPIEQALTASPLIDQACVIAEARPFTSCLIFPDLAHLRRRLGADDGRRLSDDELLHLPEIKQQIETVLNKVNENLEPWERVKQYRLIADVLSIDDGALTPTLKLRRTQLEQRYHSLIDSMYNGRPGHGDDDDGGNHSDSHDADAQGHDNGRDLKQPTAAGDAPRANAGVSTDHDNPAQGNGRDNRSGPTAQGGRLETSEGKERHESANRHH